MNYGDISIAKAVLAPATITSTTTGSAVDLRDYSGEVAVLLNVAGSGAGSVVVKLTHCDTSGGSYVDIAGAVFTEVTDTASHQKLSLNKDELKRYMKAVATIAGETPSQTVACSVIGIPSEF